MLIDFTVSNFRSIREPVTLSMVEVAPRKGKQKGLKRKRPLLTDEDISPALDVPGWDFKLLRTAGIFGANASGKSNVVRALSVMGGLLMNGSEQAYELARDPFRLGPTLEPTRFQMRHVALGRCYTYSLDIDEKILYEQLQVEGPSGEPELLFTRGAARDGEPTRIEAGQPLTGVQSILQVTNRRTPFLHVLLQLLDLPELRAYRDAVRNTGVMLHAFASAWQESTTRQIAKEPRYAPMVARLLSDFDTSIGGIRVEPVEFNGKTLHRVWVAHASVSGDTIEWQLNEESMGTQALYGLAWPILEALEHGVLLCIDEFGAHLHPQITRYIVELFQKPLTNPNGARLIFNSQDVTLQANHLLRRDQIWFTQKGAEGNTELFALSDFKVRNDMAIDQAYLDGRFGAVPFLRDLRFNSPFGDK